MDRFLGAFLIPFGDLLVDVLDPGTTLDSFLAQDEKRAETNELWPQIGRPLDVQFETILVILMTFWRPVF